MPIALITVGAPGSGKTYWLDKNISSLRTIEIFSADDIRLELLGNPTDRSQNKLVWDTLFDSVEYALSQGKSVAIDTTNARQAARRSLVHHCRHAGATSIEAIWFQTPLKTCLDRMIARDSKVRPPSIVGVYRAIEESPPCADDAFNRIMIVAS